MISKTGAVRTGFATLTLAAALAAAGPAAADVPLTPATADPVYLDPNNATPTPLGALLTGSSDAGSSWLIAHGS